MYLSHHASQSHSWELLLIIHAHNLGTGSSTPLSTGLTLLSMGAKGLALQSSVAHDKQGQLSCPSDLRAMLSHLPLEFTATSYSTQESRPYTLPVQQIKIRFNFKKKIHDATTKHNET